jgi:hypothetical protein
MVASLTGLVTRQQELDLVGGGKQTMYHMQVTSLVTSEGALHQGTTTLLEVPSKQASW